MTRTYFGMGRLGDQALIDAITQAANDAGVPPSLAVAVAQAESSLNPNAPVGTQGEIGLFQLKPSSFPGVNIWDLSTNISTGVGYLAQNYAMTGNWRDALIAYNEGPGKWLQGLRVKQAQNYADGILAAAGMSSPVPTPTPVPTPAPTPAPAPTPGLLSPDGTVTQPTPPAPEDNSLLVLAVAALVVILS